MADTHDVERGLTSEQARRLLEEVGPNEVGERGRNPVVAFLARYWGPMPWLLELACVLALVVGHATEAAIIFVLLTVNAVIGAVQSSSARRAVRLLEKDLAVRVSVLRDGAWGSVCARELVPGDVVSLALGSVAPADVCMLGGSAEADLSSLTGESLPRTIAAGDELSAGAVVVRGSVRGVVERTGERTTYGRTAALVRDARPRSRQQELLFEIVRSMMCVGCVASALVGGYALVTGGDLLSVASLVVTFLMGAVPVALPAVLAIVQAAGAMALSREGVLVTRLDSVEDAASIDVFCFDKTGTITQNRLDVTAVVPLGGVDERDLLRAALLSSDQTGTEAIDAALLAAARSRGIDARGARQVVYVPFDPEAHGYKVVLIDSCVKHELVGSPYNKRRESCERAVKAIQQKHPEVEFLRDAQPQWLEEVIGQISQEDYIRAKYAIDEVARLLEACAALAAGDYETVGRKMYGTHIGMSVLYEVSCEELDFLNEVAKECGVTGSRVMGGGFGGCTINVVPAPKYDDFINTAKAKYKERFGIDCKVYPVVISDGARRLA